MKRFILVLCLLFLFGLCYADDSDILCEKTVTFLSVGPDASSTVLEAVDFHTEAGVIVNIGGGGTQVPTWHLYIYNKEFDATSSWQTNTLADDKNLIVFDYASSTTQYQYSDPIWFASDDSANPKSLYWGVYNDDVALTDTFTFKVLYKLSENNDYGTDTY